MAQDEVKPSPADAGAAKTASAAAATGKFAPFYLLLAGVVLIAAGGGYGVAMLLSHHGPQTVQAETTAAAPPQAADSKPETPAAVVPPAEVKDEFVYCDFEPVIVNLDEPRLARYVRVTLVLAIRPENKEAALALIEKRKPELKNWLTVYFASCTLDQVRGANNLNRLQREILDALNQQLWPDQKPLINHVLFKEFAVS